MKNLTTDKGVKNMLEAREVLELISKPWATTDDVKKLASVGNNKALKIKQKIKEKIGDEYFLPYGLVPMDQLVDYLNINVKYLKKLAKIGGNNEDKN